MTILKIYIYVYDDDALQRIDQCFSFRSALVL